MNNIKRYIYKLQIEIYKESDEKKTRGFIKFLRILIMTLRGVFDKRITTESAALTYSTVFSIVPLLALFISFATGFGLDKLLEKQAADIIGGSESVSEYIFSFVHSYIEHANSGIVIGIGIVVLLYSVITLMIDIENAFNNIWQLKKGRDIFRKFTDYFSMLLILPVLIILSGGLSVFTSNLAQNMNEYPFINGFIYVLLRCGPFLITWLMFSFLYIYMPNTYVNRKNAIFSAALAAVFYQLFQYMFLFFQMRISSYNAIYGSFSAIPFFLLWIHFSWVICLVGAELTFDWQSLNHYIFNRNNVKKSQQSVYFNCLVVMSVLKEGFKEGKSFTIEELALKTSLSSRSVGKLLNKLKEARLVNVVLDKKSSESYQPALDISQLTNKKILYALFRSGKKVNKKMKEKYPDEWTSVNEL